MRQTTLFDPPPIVPNVSVPAAARPRVTRQAQRILARLAQGPVSVTELRTLACQYNARIFELRRAGYRIANVSVNHVTGQSWYALEATP